MRKLPEVPSDGVTRGGFADLVRIHNVDKQLPWHHENIVIPFTYQLKAMGNAGEEVYLETEALLGSENDRVKSRFKLDGEVSYLNYLQRPETIELKESQEWYV